MNNSILTKVLSNRKIVVLFGLGFTFLGVEFALRIGWGLGTMVLFQEDKNFEYIAQANQNRVRFGSRNIYNEYSMRSESLGKNDHCIILGFGDSVINGGSVTDHDSLATTMVEKELNKVTSGFRFLNISTGSWGPDNCAAYLKKHGAFNAKMIILFVSSHDAYDNMTFEKVVGNNQAYPNKQYPLAVIEVMAKYIIPKYSKLSGDSKGGNDLMINKNGIGFNTGFEYFKEFAEKSNIPFVVCLHAEKEEVNQHRFNDKGKEIIQYCYANGIKLISGLEIGERLSHFRDNIHLNEKGQKLWKMVLLKEIQETIGKCQY